MKSELMDRKEAAKYLRLSPGTLANWTHTNKQKVPYIKLGGRILYRKEDLNKWIESCVVNAIK